MSDKDPFSDLVRALREEGEAPAPQAKLTRERILRDLQPRAKARNKWAWTIPLAAILAGSTVLAATGQLPGIVEAAKRALGLHADAPPTPEEPTPPAVTSAPPAPTVAAPPSGPALDVPALSERTIVPPPAAPARKTVPTASAVKPKPAAVPAPETAVVAPPQVVEAAPEPSAPAPTEATPPAPETDEALALYRKAHRLHFVDQKPGAALAAWDAYLAANPKSPLVVDARYDRAVCLLRLGRTAEARAALTPFAEGRYGAYRQKDAQALLGALPSK